MTISFTAFVLLIMRLIFPYVLTVDYISIALLGLMILIYYFPYITRIKTGNIEIELQRASAAAEEIKKEIPKDEEKKIAGRLMGDVKSDFLELSFTLENSLRELVGKYINPDVWSKPFSLTRLAQILLDTKFIDIQAMELFKIISSVRNQLVHGYYIDETTLSHFVNLAITAWSYVEYLRIEIERQQQLPLEEKGGE
ncbi:MAG: hypothetical protein ACOZBZ_03645 [Patescibacteria group bacterium]